MDAQTQTLVLRLATLREADLGRSAAELLRSADEAARGAGAAASAPPRRADAAAAAVSVHDKDLGAFPPVVVARTAGGTRAAADDAATAAAVRAAWPEAAPFARLRCHHCARRLARAWAAQGASGKSGRPLTHPVHIAIEGDRVSMRFGGLFCRWACAAGAARDVAARADERAQLLNLLRLLYLWLEGVYPTSLAPGPSRRARRSFGGRLSADEFAAAAAAADAETRASAAGATAAGTRAGTGTSAGAGTSAGTGTCTGIGVGVGGGDAGANGRAAPPAH